MNSEFFLSDEKIKQQKNRLNFIIEGINAGTWEWNLQTGKTVFNNKWAEMLGYKLEELEPTTIKTWEKYTHPEDLKKAKTALKKHFRQESDFYNAELRMKHKDGHWVWINDRGRIISRNKDNQPLKMFGIHLDVTARKKKEIKIKESEKRYRPIFNSAPNPIFVIDQKGDYHDLNARAEELTGYSRKELLQLNIRDLIAPENVKKALKFTKKLFEKGQANTEISILAKNNEKIDIILDSVSLNDDRYLGFAKDITKRKKQRDKLEFQHLFQKNLAEISSELLEINLSNIDRKINNSLEKIGIFFDVDRSYIFQFDQENNEFSNTYEWCKKGIESYRKKLQNINVDRFSWWMNKLYNNEIINIADLKEIISKAKSEKKLLERKNVKSVVIKPIFIENKLFGFFGFDSVQAKKEFPQEKIRLLKIFTDIITRAFSKHIYDQKIRKLTYRDSLTGLYNRRFFEEELERLDTKRQLPISIITADINGLKIVNDSLGHKKGDQLLKKSADILKKATRKEDILARQGGDEFAILLPKTEKEKAEKIIKRIKKEAKQTTEDELTVSVALGAAVKNNSEEDIGEVLKKADNDMYQNKLSESRSTKSRIVQSLLNTLEVKSNETKEHTLRMTKLAFEFGEKLNLTNSELNRLSLLSTLHDIGKTTIAEKILKKTGRLTAAEWGIIKEHPERGYKIANSSEEFALVANDILAHHERWDGGGYPQKLKGREIPYLARIITIIDAYDVMTHDRSYSRAVSQAEALAEIKKCAGSQFDPELAEKFIEMIES